MSVQILEKNGKPEWAILPYADYLALVEDAEEQEDIRDYDELTAGIKAGTVELFPDSVVVDMINGKNPIKLWREFRTLTQQQLAEKVGISVPFLSQLESGKRTCSMKVMVALSSALSVDIELLIVK
jgi:DNA-binding XRE family transcriptional regulator